MYAIFGRASDFGYNFRHLTPTTLNCGATLSSCVQNYSYSIIAAIAAVISCISGALSLPRLLIKRFTSTPRICSVSTAEIFVKPLMLLGSIQTCQMFLENRSCQPVIGETNLIGRCPTPSELITTAGRIF